MRWGIVCPYLGTRMRLLRASSTPFWMASGTSRALPYPTPTTESSSPTATSAVNEKRRPPLTTLATRLISITRSCRSSPLGLTVSTAMKSVKVAECRGGAASELQPSLAGPLGQRLDVSVVAVAAAVEDASPDAGFGGALREHLADPLRLLHAAEISKLGLGPVDRGQGRPGRVVDQLRG